MRFQAMRILIGSKSNFKYIEIVLNSLFKFLFHLGFIVHCSYKIVSFQIEPHFYKFS